METIEARVIQKIATPEQWRAISYTPYKGEFLIVGDASGKVTNIKVGDGSNDFDGLEYMFDSIQQNANYIPVSGYALPTPEADIGFTMLVEGDYTFGGNPAFTVTEGNFGIASWDGSSWSLVSMGEVSPVQKTNYVEPENFLPVESDGVYRTVTPIKNTLESIIVRDNYFNKNDVIEGSLVNFNPAEYPEGKCKIGNISGWSRSGFIKLRAGTYKIVGHQLYENKMYAGLWSIPTDEYGDRLVDNEFTITETKYLVFNVKSDVAEADLNIIQVVVYGSDETTYHEYDSVQLNKNSFDDRTRMDLRSIEDVTLSENRIDPEKLTLNSYIDVSGTVRPSSTFDISDFIRIQDGETLSAQTNSGVYSGLYNIDFKPIPGSFSSAPNANGYVHVTGTKEGVYARFSLRKTIPYRASTGVNPPYTRFTKDIPQSEVNSIKNTLPSPNLLHLGQWGQNGAVYKAVSPGGVHRIKFDFKMNFNPNTNIGDVPIARVGDNGINISIITADPILQREDASQTLTNHYQQTVGFASGFRVGSTTILQNYPRQKPFVGVDSFSIWLKNMGDGTLEGRQLYLEEYQDLSVAVTEDDFIIFRDGIGYNGLPFNNGDVSNVLVVPLKNSGVAKSMVELYEDLMASIGSVPLLDGTEIDFENIAEDRNTDDLLRFEKVKLVTYANFQVNPPSTARSNQYDSFPMHFPYWKDERWHTCEIVSQGNRLYCAIDGATTNTVNVFQGESPVYIGGTNIQGSDVEIANIEIDRGSFGNTEVVGGKIISDTNPYVLGLCGHITHDTYYSDDAGDQSLARLLRVIEDLKNKGYYLASMTDILEWKLNNKKLPKRTAFIMLDDWNIDNFWTNRHVRNALLKNGAKINNCLIENRFTEENKERLTNTILNMRLRGWDTVPHTWYHDVRYAWKTSLQLEEEIDLIIPVAEETHQLSSVLVLPFGVPLTNALKMIQYKGIQMAIDTRQIDSDKGTWEMSISREALQYVNGVTIQDVFNYAL